MNQYRIEQRNADAVEQLHGHTSARAQLDATLPCPIRYSWDMGRFRDILDVTVHRWCVVKPQHTTQNRQTVDNSGKCMMYHAIPDTAHGQLSQGQLDKPA